MINNDYVGTFKYKFILPFIFIISFLMQTLGHHFLPNAYLIFLITLLIYLNIKLFTILVKLWILIKRTSQAINVQYQPPIYNKNIYLFIIPNYKQQIELLQLTLNDLARHQISKNYVVCLAMENHQEGSAQKAAKLISMYNNTFKSIFATYHVVQPNQSKGKASNVNWAATHMYEQLQKNDLNPEDIILNIIDADANIPHQYILHMQNYLRQHPDLRFKTFFSPPLIFCRNHKNVPFMVRVYDNMNSMFQGQQLNRIGDIAFPISNYSLSYKLAQRIGFWDTCADAIGQDYHTFMKSFWKTDQQVIIQPIYTPFNMLNVESQGYFSTIKAKFWQAQRHFQGCADVGYCIKQYMEGRKTCRSGLLLFLILQTYILFAIIVGSLMGSVFVAVYKLFYHEEQYSLEWLKYLSIFQSVVIGLLFTSYEIYRRLALKQFHRGENKVEGFCASILILVQYFVGLMLNLYTITCWAFLHAIWTSPFGQKQYIVAQKGCVKEENDL